MIQIQEINFPLDCMVIHHDFYDYDPKISFNEADSLKYLNEDLLQCKFPLVDIIIDLGWYGDVILNKGEFRIHIIKSENWEIPSNIIYPKSVDETKELLTKILQYYTSIGVKDAHDIEHN
jgi:hypothetical protein